MGTQMMSGKFVEGFENKVSSIVSLKSVYGHGLRDEVGIRGL